PVRAVRRVIAGDRVAVAGEPQPARACRRDGTGQAGRIARVVPLHPHPVAAGDHHRRVGRALAEVLLDDDPGLRPRHEAGPQRARVEAGLVVCRVYRTLRKGRERGRPDRDAAVPGERLAHEVEAVGHRLAARTQRERGRAAAGRAVLYRPAPARAHTPTGDVPAGRDEEQPEPGRHQDRDDHADDPAAHRAELGPLRVQQLREAVAPVLYGRAVFRDGGHCAAPPAAGAALNSTASLVSSMYASSRVARCADTSANGTRLSVSAAATRSAGRPETMSWSGPVIATLAPACASTVIASPRAAERSWTWSPDAAAIKSRTLASAMTFPRPA